jgi:hypothetical protein
MSKSMLKPGYTRVRSWLSRERYVLSGKLLLQQQERRTQSREAHLQERCFQLERAKYRPIAAPDRSENKTAHVDLPNAVSEGQGVTHMGLSLRHQSDAAA